MNDNIDATFQTIKTYIDARVQVDTTKPTIAGASGLSFGARLKATRELRALNQSQLAKTINVTPAAISKFEAMSKNPTLANFVAICQSLQVSADFLLFGR